MLTKYLSVFLISMVPLIELRGAIPVGVAMGLPLWKMAAEMTGGAMTVESAVAGVRHRHHRQYAPRAVHLLLCPQGAGVGCG